jgi:four helix bundle protein
MKVSEFQGCKVRAENSFRFLGTPGGSLLELETQLAIARDLGYLDERNYVELDTQTYEVHGLLNRLLQSMSGQNQTKP